MFFFLLLWFSVVRQHVRTSVFFKALWRSQNGDRVKHAAVFSSVIRIADTLHLITASLWGEEGTQIVLVALCGHTPWCRWRWQTRPVVGADARVRGARAGAEVKGRDGNAAALQTHHVWPARSPVLHVTQIQAVIQHRMATSVGQMEAGLPVSTPPCRPTTSHFSEHGRFWPTQLPDRFPPFTSKLWNWSTVKSSENTICWVFTISKSSLLPSEMKSKQNQRGLVWKSLSI